MNQQTPSQVLVKVLEAERRRLKVVAARKGVRLQALLYGYLMAGLTEDEVALDPLAADTHIPYSDGGSEDD